MTILYTVSDGNNSEHFSFIPVSDNTQDIYLYHAFIHVIDNSFITCIFHTPIDGMPLS